MPVLIVELLGDSPSHPHTLLPVSEEVVNALTGGGWQDENGEFS